MRIFEVESNTIFVAFAYANPPTKEYGDYFNKIKEDADGAKYVIYLNPTQNNELNPFGFHDLFKANKKIYPNINFSRDKFNNPIDILRELSKDYSNVVYYTTPEFQLNQKKLELYAEKFGINSFTVRSIGSKNEGANEKARKSIQTNDFNTFIEQFDYTNKNYLSQLFITLRKIMVIGSNSGEVTETNKNIYSNYILSEIATLEGRFSILSEHVSKDPLGNKYYDLRDQGKLKNIRIVEFSDVKQPAIGKCKKTNKDILFVKELTFEYIDKHRTIINELLETTTAGSVASVNMPLGEPVRRIYKDNLIDSEFEGLDSLSSAMTAFINKNGYIDNKVIERLRKRYGKI